MKDLLQNMSFRITILYALLFSISSTILVTFIFLVAASESDEQLREYITNETKNLQDVYQTRGLEALTITVRERSKIFGENKNYYSLRSKSGQVIAGNLPTAKFKKKWSSINIAEKGDEPDENDWFEVILYGVTLTNNEQLVIGASGEYTKILLNKIVGALGGMLILTLFFAVGGGLLMSRASMLRISSISAVSKKIMDGDLSIRLPTNGSGDELDKLIVRVNIMLGRIELLMEAVKQVTNDIAHDLKTPLGRLRQNLDRARENGESIEDWRKAFDQALIETDAILETFNALLRLSQIEGGATQAHFANENLSKLLHNLVDTYEPVAQEKKQALTSQIQSGIDFFCDKELLTQLVVNIIENAVTHSPHGASIHVELQQSNEHLTFTVSDTGPGIPVIEHEKVFQRFYQLDKSRSSANNGLGLALVRAIAILHRASINLLNNNPGLKVVVHFPLNDDRL